MYHQAGSSKPGGPETGQVCADDVNLTHGNIFYTE
jgi:hypothetical protein